MATLIKLIQSDMEKFEADEAADALRVIEQYARRRGFRVDVEFVEARQIQEAA